MIWLLHYIFTPSFVSKESNKYSYCIKFCHDCLISMANCIACLIVTLATWTLLCICKVCNLWKLVNMHLARLHLLTGALQDYFRSCLARIIKKIPAFSFVWFVNLKDSLYGSERVYEWVILQFINSPLHQSWEFICWIILAMHILVI